MSKYAGSVAVAFATQSAEGTYDTTLDGISATLQGDPNGTDDGLVLGDPESGIKESGLEIEFEREAKEQAFVGTSFTRPISHYQGVEVAKFSFSFPFCGSRRTTTGTPVDNDFLLGVGVRALLGGAGFTGSTWGSGVGYSYVPGITVPYFSALVYVNGVRYELLDCLVSSLKIEFEPEKIPIATADIMVGSIKDPTTTSITPVSLPTLTYGAQSTISAPVVESVSHAWSATRGFSKFTLNIEPVVEELPDSNSASGKVLEFSGRKIEVEAELYGDDASSNESFEAAQLWASQASDLASMSFTVGSAAAGAAPAKAVRVTLATPEVVSLSPIVLGSKAGAKVKLAARNATANNELSFIYL